MLIGKGFALRLAIRQLITGKRRYTGDISNVCTPDSIRGFWVKLFIKDVVKLAAEIGVSCSGSPWLDPLGFHAHLFHVSSDRSLSDTDAGFTKFSGDFGGTVVLVGFVINLLD